MLFWLYWKIQPADDSEATQMLVGEYAVRIGLEPHQGRAEMDRAVERYFREHPLNSRLKQEIDEILIGASSGVYDGPKAYAFARFQGSRPAARSQGGGLKLIALRTGR